MPAPGLQGWVGEAGRPGGDPLTAAGRLRAAAAIGLCWQSGGGGGGRGGDSVPALKRVTGGVADLTPALCGRDHNSLAPSPFCHLKTHIATQKDQRTPSNQQVSPPARGNRKSRPKSWKSNGNAFGLMCHSLN